MQTTPHAVVQLLKEMVATGATDLLLKVPNRPTFRVDGQLVPVGRPRLGPDDTRGIAAALLGLADRDLPLARVTDEEFAVGVGGVGRFRVHLYRQRGTLGLLVHRLAGRPPRLADLGAPEGWVDRACRPGLVLVAGARREAMLAALVDGCNAARRVQVQLLEELPEYLHGDRLAAICQREVGIDTADWETGLRSAIRQRPDVLALGDVPGPEVAERLLEAVDRGIAAWAAVPGEGVSDAVLRFSARLQGETQAVQARVRAALAGVVVADPEGARAQWVDDGDPEPAEEAEAGRLLA